MSVYRILVVLWHDFKRDKEQVSDKMLGEDVCAQPTR